VSSELPLSLKLLSETTEPQPPPSS
jgi:hypothetical protein